MSKDIFEQFSPTLLSWHDPDDRPLPWKNISDPYLIWISEIILQQTRAVQAIPYYFSITKRFPTVQSLASADIDDLLSLWQGLGYYTRARNLHFSAKMVVEKFGGFFPDNHDDIISLKGVGKYTAAAISSFAFGLPYPVVDGNVIRIASRYFDIAEPVDTKEGLKIINDFVDLIFDKTKPAAFNQAIMDFGATVCLPKKPLCTSCPFSESCLSYEHNLHLQRPIKSKKLVKKIRHFNFLRIQTEKEIYIQRRNGKDIWQGLYQLPLIEGKEFSKKSTLRKEIKSSFHLDVSPEPIFTHKQTLTHQIIHTIVWDIGKSELSNSNGLWVDKSKLNKYGFPKTLTLFLKDI